MSKIAIVYWSGTGNTESMAYAVSEGAKGTGADTALFTAAEFSGSQVNEYDAIAFGCPAMGAEELEETEFAPLFQDCKSSLPGKRVALFGSYGWGDGEWMRTWEDECRDCGAVIAAESVICQETPDEDALQNCRALGAALA